MMICCHLKLRMCRKCASTFHLFLSSTNNYTTISPTNRTKRKLHKTNKQIPQSRPHLRNQSCLNMKPDGLHTHLQSTHLVSKTGSLEKMVPFLAKNKTYLLYNICVCYSCVKDNPNMYWFLHSLLKGFWRWKMGDPMSMNCWIELEKHRQISVYRLPKSPTHANLYL